LITIGLSGEQHWTGHRTHFVGVMDIDPARRALEYGATSPSPIRKAESERP
jgi:hypothetical protein